MHHSRVSIKHFASLWALKFWNHHMHATVMKPNDGGPRSDGQASASDRQAASDMAGTPGRIGGTKTAASLRSPWLRRAGMGLVLLMAFFLTARTYSMLLWEARSSTYASVAAVWETAQRPHGLKLTASSAPTRRDAQTTMQSLRPSLKQQADSAA
eukprot:2780431-Pleurochrysis_carterae.AAC.4